MTVKGKIYFYQLIGSHPCESFFRKPRSLTATESTVISSTILDFLDKIKGIEFLLDFRCGMEGKSQFTRDSRQSVLSATTENIVRGEPLPSDAET